MVCAPASQLSGNPVGYYAPRQTPINYGGKTLLLVHEDVRNPKISDQPLLDDKLIEVSWAGEILWSWRAHEHFSELGFDDAAKEVLSRDPGLKKLAGGAVGDWLHINSASFVGPNRHFDAGDHRFHPDNVIWDAREANIIAVTDTKTGNIAWRLGPNYEAARPSANWVGSSVSIMPTSFRAVCRAKAICCCSTMAVGRATANPTLLRRPDV